MSLRNLIAEDIINVFLDTDELAEEHTIILDGVEYSIPVVVGHDESLPFGKLFDGVYQSDLVLALSEADIIRAPVKGQILEFDGENYLVSKCSNGMGLLVIKLEVPDI